MSSLILTENAVKLDHCCPVGGVSVDSVEHVWLSLQLIAFQETSLPNLFTGLGVSMKVAAAFFSRNAFSNDCAK